MNGIEALKKRADALSPAGTEYRNTHKEDEAAIKAIVLEVWPSFEADNPDLLTPAGVERVFGDPRYREIDKRVFAMRDRKP
jgi:hypothetical protein